MKYLFLFLFLASQVIPEEPETITVKLSSTGYQFFWHGPKATNGCWKIEQYTKKITNAFNVDKKECKSMEKAKEFFEYFEYATIEITRRSKTVLGFNQ